MLCDGDSAFTWFAKSTELNRSESEFGNLFDLEGHWRVEKLVGLSERVLKFWQATFFCQIWRKMMMGLQHLHHDWQLIDPRGYDFIIGFGFWKLETLWCRWYWRFWVSYHAHLKYFFNMKKKHNFRKPSLHNFIKQPKYCQSRAGYASLSNWPIPATTTGWTEHIWDMEVSHGATTKVLKS